MQNSVHPSAVIGPDVMLGERNVIGPFAVLLGPLILGDDNWIGPHVSIGGPPEIRGVDQGEAWANRRVGTGVFIGSRNVVREGTAIHQGWFDRTSVGDDCFVMNQVYIAHDCVIGDGVTIASSVVMGGHCHVGHRANLGLNASLHQRSRIGEGAMVGMSAVVTRPIPPWALAYGSPARVSRANVVAMQRAGLPKSSVEWLDVLYRGRATAGDTSIAAADVDAAPADLRACLLSWSTDLDAEHA